MSLVAVNNVGLATFKKVSVKVTEILTLPSSRPAKLAKLIELEPFTTDIEPVIVSPALSI